MNGTQFTETAMLKIFPLYAVVAVVFFVALNINVIRNRPKTRIPIGDGNNEDLLRARSIHSIYHEFVTISSCLRDH